RDSAAGGCAHAHPRRQPLRRRDLLRPRAQRLLRGTQRQPRRGCAAPEPLVRGARLDRGRPPRRLLAPLPAIHVRFWNAITRRAAAPSVASVATATNAPCVLAALGARAPEAGRHHWKGR